MFRYFNALFFLLLLLFINVLFFVCRSLFITTAASFFNTFHIRIQPLECHNFFSFLFARAIVVYILLLLLLLCWYICCCYVLLLTRFAFIFIVYIFVSRLFYSFCLPPPISLLRGSQRFHLLLMFDVSLLVDFCLLFSRVVSIFFFFSSFFL